MKNVLIKSVMIILFCVGFNLSAQTNYYFSASSGNDANTGKSPSSPWKSLDKLYSIWSSVNPGDSILFKRGDTFAPSTVGSRIGVIRIPSGISGTANAYIVIGAYGSGARPIISGENTTEYHQAFRTGDIAYFIVQDLEIHGYVLFRPQENISKGMHHFKLIRVKLQGGIDQNDQTKISFFNPYSPSKVPEPNVSAPIHHIEISHCEFYDTEGEDAVNIGAAGDSIWVHHNVWKNVSEEALDIGGGTGHLIEYNFVSGASVNGMKFHSQFAPMHDIIVRGNVIIGAGMKTGGTALAFQNVTGGKVYNNTMYSPYAGFFGNRDRVQPESYYGNYEGNQVYNNIFYGIVQVQGSWVDAPIGDKLLYDAPVQNLWRDNSFSNNIYWKPPVSNNVLRFWENPQYPDQTAHVNDSRTVTYNNPTRFATEWGNKADGTEYMTDPLLSNPYWNTAYDYGNMEPASNSPAINGGKIIAEYKEDINGNPIPSGSNPTIGAYQYTGVDATAPTVTSASSSNANSVVVNFSERVDINSAQIASNYSVTGSVTVSSASLSANEQSVTLTTSSLQTGNSYTVTVNNVSDKAGNSISGSNSATFTYVDPDLDTTPPILNEVKLVDYTTVDVTFNENISSSSATAIGNYSITNGISIVSASVKSSTTVTLTTSTHTDGQSYTLTTSGISDQAGNTMTSTSSKAYTCTSGGSQVATGANLVENGNFEKGSKESWNESNSIGDAVYTFSVNSTSPLSGSYEGVVSITQAGTNNSRPLIYAAMSNAVESGKSYILRMKTKVNSGSPKIKYYSSGLGIKAFPGELSGTQEWEIDIDPATAVTSYVSFYLDGTSTGSFSIDDLQFSEKVEMISLNDVRVMLQGAYSADTLSTILKKRNALPLTQPFRDTIYNYQGNEKVASIPDNDVDWLLLELRTGTAASSIVAKRAVLIDKNGFLRDTCGSTSVVFPGLSDGNYYLVVRHRNHLDIMSSSPIAVSGGVGTYDFTTAANKAYGTDSQVELKTGLYGMYSGDGDCNGIVNVLDYSCVGSNIFSNGYICGDYDMNSIINILDYQKTIFSLFKSVQFPN